MSIMVSCDKTSRFKPEIPNRGQGSSKCPKRAFSWHQGASNKQHLKLSLVILSNKKCINKNQIKVICPVMIRVEWIQRHLLTPYIDFHKFISFKSLNLTTMSREGPFMKSKTDILTSPFSVPFQEKEKMQNFICADVSSRLLQLESCKWVFKLLDAPSFIRLFVRCNKITKQKQ